MVASGENSGRLDHMLDKAASATRNRNADSYFNDGEFVGSVDDIANGYDGFYNCIGDPDTHF